MAFQRSTRQLDGIIACLLAKTGKIVFMFFKPGVATLYRSQAHLKIQFLSWHLIRVAVHSTRCLRPKDFLFRVVRQLLG